MQKNSKNVDKNALTAVEHFSEMKRRIFTAVICFVIFFGICLYYNQFFMDIVLKLGENLNYRFVVLTPAETLVQTFRLSGVFALLITLPIIVYEILMFISPAFAEKFTILRLVILSIIAFGVFGLGCLFTYKYLLPFVLKYLLDYTGNYNVTSEISLESYISFVSLIIFCIGIMFEMPVVSSMLAKIGLLSAELMQKLIKPGIVVIFILAALITPPDIVSQMLVAVPMCLLLMISLGMGIALMPEYIVRHHHKNPDLKILPIEKDDGTAETLSFEIAWSKSNSNPAVDRLLAWLEDN